ncbi:MAG: hypothetical protein WHT63_00295 [Tepidiforma sp.]
MAEEVSAGFDGAFVPPPGTVFAEVAVHTTQPARRPFTYAVPPEMRVEPGMAVFVPFGPRIVQGVVLAVTDRSEVEAVRPVSAVLDPEPLLDPARAELARWIAEEYLAPLWECVACFLPAGFGQKPVTMVSPVEVPPLLPVDPKDRAILQYLAEHGQVTLDELREEVGQVPLATLQRLQESGHLTVAQGLARPAGRPKFERRVALAVDAGRAREEAAALTGARERSVEGRLLARLSDAGDIPLSEARGLGAAPAHPAHMPPAPPHSRRKQWRQPVQGKQRCRRKAGEIGCEHEPQHSHPRSGRSRQQKHAPDEPRRHAGTPFSQACIDGLRPSRLAPPCRGAGHQPPVG